MHRSGFSFSINHLFSPLFCRLVRVGSHSQSENMRMLGRARPPQQGQVGKGSLARRVSSSIFNAQARFDRPNRLSALIDTLQMHEGTVAFVDIVSRKAGLLKMPIDVGGKDKGRKVLFVDPLQEKRKPEVRFGLAIKVQPVSVEAPS